MTYTEMVDPKTPDRMRLRAASLIAQSRALTEEAYKLLTEADRLETQAATLKHLEAAARAPLPSARAESQEVVSCLVPGCTQQAGHESGPRATPHGRGVDNETPVLRCRCNRPEREDWSHSPDSCAYVSPEATRRLREAQERVMAPRCGGVVDGLRCSSSAGHMGKCVPSRNVP